MNLTDENATTALGDFTSAVIDFFRDQECAVRYLNEAQQREVIGEVRSLCERLILSAVHRISSSDNTSFSCSLQSIVRKGSEAKMVLTANALDPKVRDAFLFDGGRVLITLIDPQEYMGGELPQAEPDQKQIQY